MTSDFNGAETLKAQQNFGKCQTPRPLIRAYALVKEACLRAIQETDSHFPEETFAKLMDLCLEIREGSHDDLFQLPLAQGGAGTSLNMNLNEALSYLAKCAGLDVHPLEDLNRFQSTNDTFPTAVTLLIYEGLNTTEKAVITLQEVLVRQERLWAQRLMVGRTELQDALPITLGQVFASWAGMIERDRWRISKLKERLRTIPLGGTAIGTCFNAPQDYVFAAEKHLRRLTGLPLCRSQNLTDEIASLDKYSEAASGLRLLAENLFKITGDLLVYTSSFSEELRHPNLQAGSTIMAAKVNPVILELVRGLSIGAQGEAWKISQWTQNGQLQLNPYLPFIMESFFKLFDSLDKAMDALTQKFFSGFEVNHKKMDETLVHSKALLNALLPHLGYDKVKAFSALCDDRGIERWEDFAKALQEFTLWTEETVTNILDPANLTSYLKR